MGAQGEADRDEPVSSSRLFVLFALVAPVFAALAALVWIYIAYGIGVASLALIPCVLVLVGVRKTGLLVAVVASVAGLVPLVAVLVLVAVLFPVRWAFRVIAFAVIDRVDATPNVGSAPTTRGSYDRQDHAERDPEATIVAAAESVPAAANELRAPHSPVRVPPALESLPPPPGSVGGGRAQGSSGGPVLARLVNAVAATATALLILGGVGSLATLDDRSREVSTLRSGYGSLEEGDVRAAIVDFTEVAQAHPQSLRALSGFSCALWLAGYQDQSVVAYQQILDIGYPVGMPGWGVECVMDDPEAAGLSWVTIDRRSYVYPTPLQGDLDGGELVALLNETVAAGPASRTQSHLLLGCMFERIDFRLMAAVHMQKAETAFGLIASEGTEPARVVDVPDRCLASADEYILDGDGIAVTVFPRDVELRLFDPTSSAIPKVGGRVLPLRDEP